MPKSRKPTKKTTAKPVGFEPKRVQRPGADAARLMAQKVKPMPLPGKSRGR